MSHVFFAKVDCELELESKEKLNKVYIDLTKALKVCEALVNKAEVTEGLSARCKQTMEELQVGCQKADMCLSDVNYALKYKKDKAGNKVGIMAAKKIVE